MMHNYASAIRFTRGLVFSFEEFLHSFDERDSATADVSYVTGHTQPWGPHSYIRRTIINDLTPPAEDILKSFSASIRNYIHSAMKNELCIYKFVSAPSESEVLNIYELTTKFNALMGINRVNLDYLKALSHANRLYMSYTYDQNGVMLAAHVYRMSALRPELMYSIRTMEGNADTDRRRLISKSNLYSHYRDMLHLKSLGFAEYDFGGVSDGRSNNIKWRSIDEFKMYFGGTVKTFYNSILYNTIKSKTYLLLRGAPFK